jgi:hypothetical protein
LKELQVPEILNFLIAIDELNIQTLIQCIQEYLIKYEYEFLHQNCVEILEIIYQYITFSILWNYCLDIICENPSALFESDKFINFKEPLLELLFKRDNFFSDEIVIWNNLIKWSFAQNPSIQQDVKKWNKEEISIMEKTLHRFIPLIRFYHISSEDFLLKVYPFKVLLPKDLINNIFAFHMVPNEKLSINIESPRIPSIIINSKHFAIFSSWIEKKDDSYYNERNIPFKFNLLYRASRDGNTPTIFHAKCDNKGATIVIVKVTNSEQIVGGYNPLQWNSSIAWKSTNDSFLYSFTDRNNLDSAKVGHVNNSSNHAIYWNEIYGPAFGGGHDLFQDHDGTWKIYCSYSYPKIDIPKDYTRMNGYYAFNVEDYEVYQVVKNNHLNQIY